MGISGPCKHNSAPSNAALPSQQNKVQQSSSKVAQQPPSVVKDVKSDSIGRGVDDLASKPSADKEKIPSLPSNKKKGPNGKSSTGIGGSLANLWGRASTKSKSSGVPSDDSDSVQNPYGLFPFDLLLEFPLVYEFLMCIIEIIKQSYIQ